jgi:hypothetical protein
MGVFYEFTFALILIDYFFYLAPHFQIKNYLNKKEEPARMLTLPSDNKSYSLNS